LIVHPQGVHDEPETSDEISLGHMYEYGDGVAQNYATALHWYELAAVTRDTVAGASVQRVERLLNLPSLGSANRIKR
jgi:TPR repeat protein